MIAQLQIIGTASYDFEFVSLQCTTFAYPGAATWNLPLLLFLIAQGVFLSTSK